MARPTKEEIERKEELKKFYKRDQKIYTVFEKYTDSLDNYTTLQVFCTICAVRRERFLSSEDDILLNDIDIYKLHNEYRVVDYPIYLIRGLSALLLDDNLDNEGHKKVKRALKLLLEYSYNFKAIFEKEKRIKEGKEKLDNNFLESLEVLKEILFMLFESKKGKLFNAVYETFIRKKINQFANKSYFIEVDLTKPKKEIIKFIENIKDDFDANPFKFENTHDFLGLTPEIFKCDIKDCEVFKLGKRGTNKPINGIMADILFIYDCYKVGLDKRYTIKEINRYWNEIKNLNKDEMSERTYENYKKIAIDYIEKQKYLCYITGYNIPPEDIKPDF